jgi:hypothetical protein
VRLDEQGLDEYTDDFAYDAFRQETRTFYAVDSDRDGFERFLAGEPGPSTEVVGPWGAWVQAQRARGATVRRLRILFTPPEDYLRFELGWAYTANLAAGEDIRILDLTERARPPGIVDAEYWMLDRQRAVRMTYADNGQWLHGDTVEGKPARPVVRALETAWSAGEPFGQWWERHPEYHGPVHARA